MRIVFIADARSPIARNWIMYYVERGHEVHVISSYPCALGELPGATVRPVPIAFSGFSRVRHDGTIGQAKSHTLLTPLLASMRSGAIAGMVRTARHWLAPLDLQRHVGKMRRMINEVMPDLVHAMRIPFEGIIAAKATPPAFPLLVSVWGNDFTLFGSRGAMAGRYLRQTMRVVSALHCDCERDLKLAKAWGFDTRKAAVVLPGAGGVQTKVFNPQAGSQKLRTALRVSADAPVIINPRGFRDYVRNDVFFRAIPLVLQARPDAVFLSLAMKGNPIAENWLERFGIADNVRLLPHMPRAEMAELFQLAMVTVSPSLHDGTPNTLLEAMACGCLPIAGDIESVREWISDGVNGLLCDPTDPAALAQAILRALNDTALHASARRHNVELIAQRADYEKVMSQSESFYQQVIEQAAK
jgi:glycosyltransferase involved in cell wall biosynthesis